MEVIGQETLLLSTPVAVRLLEAATVLILNNGMAVVV